MSIATLPAWSIRLEYVCHRLLTGVLLLNVAITANAQALSAQTSHAATLPLTDGPLITAPLVTAPRVTTPLVTAAFINEISRLPALERPTYGKPVGRPAIVADTAPDQTHQISRLNQDFIQREAERAQREGAASRTPRITLAGDPPLAMIPLALGMASVWKWVDPDSPSNASAATDLLGGLLGVSTGS